MSDRKYRHRGYQDSGAEPGGRRSPQQPRKERLEGAPRGRTAGGFGPEVFKCALCGTLQRTLEEVTRETTCSKCGADLHTCTNCKHFDTMARWECRAEISDRVKPKDARNHCESFETKIVKDLVGGKVERQSTTPDDARAAFENLFKK